MKKITSIALCFIACKILTGCSVTPVKSIKFINSPDNKIEVSDKTLDSSRKMRVLKKTGDQFVISRDGDPVIITCYMKTPGLDRSVYDDPATGINGVVSNGMCYYVGPKGKKNCTGEDEHLEKVEATKSICDDVRDNEAYFNKKANPSFTF